MHPEQAPNGCRRSTAAAHRDAVERVILKMRERLEEPFSLQDMAQVACLSPFHFNRVFHQTTGIPPAQFLYALRLEAAKRLLLTTPLSVTEVCFRVGYNSIGTFTSRFTQLVGLAPRRFRRLAGLFNVTLLERLRDKGVAVFNVSPPARSVVGRIVAPRLFAELIFVGLFRTQIPQGRPSGGTLLDAPGPYHLGPVPDGRYHVFAAAFPLAEDPLAYLLPDANSLLVGVGDSPVIVRGGKAGGAADVLLRPVRIADPPILIALPFLLADALSGKGIATV